MTARPFPFRPQETELKALYTSGAFEASPMESLEFSALIASHPECKSISASPLSVSPNQLSETNYFLSSLDISTIQHLRYLPAVYHKQDFFELECVLSGEITTFIRGDNKQETLKAGDILILAPETNHASCTFSDDGIMINILVRKSTFEANFINLIPDNDIFKKFFIEALYKKNGMPYLLFKTGNPTFLQNHVLKIKRESERNNRYKNTMLSALLSEFCVELLRHYEKDMVLPSLLNVAGNENIIFILEYLQKNYATITLSHLAEFFNYSERQMQRIIKSATGKTFKENIIELRLNEAKQLLSQDNLTVSDIADRLGYYDSSSFRKEFKRYFGCAPSNYLSKA